MRPRKLNNNMSDPKFLIKYPIITEKSTSLSGFGKYVFLVQKNSTAPEVKKAVESAYKVNVTKIHIINTKPKPRQWSRGTRIVSKKAGYKKAIVTLKTGQKLDILPH